MIETENRLSKIKNGTLCYISTYVLRHIYVVYFYIIIIGKTLEIL